MSLIQPASKAVNSDMLYVFAMSVCNARCRPLYGRNIFQQVIIPHNLGDDQFVSSEIYKALVSSECPFSLIYLAIGRYVLERFSSGASKYFVCGLV